MSELPPPPIPSDVDCRDLDGFMLNAERLMASELWALSNGEEFKAAFALWCRAWKQLPAASLPDDDRTLAAFSGAGSRWRKVKEMALRGFVKCSDGRLYHMVLAPEALKAYTSKVAFQRKRETDAERLKKWRQDQRETQTETRSKYKPETESETRFVAEGQGQGQVIIRDKIITSSSASVAGPPSADQPPNAAMIDLDFVKEILATLGKPEGNLVNEIATPPRWRAAGYTPAEIRQAAEIARARQQNVRNLKYLDAIIDGLRADAIPNSSGSKPSAPAADQKPLSEEDWRKRIATWRSSGLSWPTHWGPEPGKPGCLVPARLSEDADRMVTA